MADIVDTTIQGAEGPASSPNGVNQGPANEADDKRYTDPNKALVYKVRSAPLDDGSSVEIRPSIKRKPNETPFFIELVDGNRDPFAIQINGGPTITSLKLTPNPDTIIINSAKMISRYHTMTRWVEEYWGDELDMITMSGSSFSFFAFDTDAPQVGLTVGHRNDTKPYELLRKMVTFFKLNGCIYQDDKTFEGGYGSSSLGDYANNVVSEFLNDPVNEKYKLNHPRRGLIKERLYVQVRFDYMIYLGYFETFDITEDANNPFRMMYNLVFKSEKTIWNPGFKKASNSALVLNTNAALSSSGVA